MPLLFPIKGLLLLIDCPLRHVTCAGFTADICCVAYSGAQSGLIADTQALCLFQEVIFAFNCIVDACLTVSPL